MPNESATTVNSMYFPLTRKVVGTAAAATVVVWSPERPRTVNPPPSQPAEAAAPPRLTPRTAVASKSKSVPAVMRQDARDTRFGCMKSPCSRARSATSVVTPIQDCPRDGFLARASADEIESAAADAGMRTLWDDGVDKVAAGLTTIDELRRTLL